MIFNTTNKKAEIEHSPSHRKTPSNATKDTQETNSPSHSHIEQN